MNDFILNGQGHGEIGSVVADPTFDPGARRPYISDDGPNSGKLCVNILTGRSRTEGGITRMERAEVLLQKAFAAGVRNPVLHDVMTGNASALKKDEWVQMDNVLQRVSRQRLRAWADLSNAKTVGGFNGFAKSTYEYQAITDSGSAVVDMEMLAAGRNDSPLFKMRSIPLPITHSDFSFGARFLAISRGGSSPVDTTMAEAAGRRVSEEVEKTTIGTVTSVQYGGVSGASNPAYNTDNTSKVYGYLTHPQRITGTTITTPTGNNPEATVANILAMRQTMYGYNFFGPYMVYHSTDWDTYLDNDYARLGGSNANMTLRDRLRKIEGIQDVRRLDYLTSSTNPFTLIMVQMTGEFCMAINGMDLTTVQWETRGGALQNWKVMCIWVPLIKYDTNGVAPVYQNSI